MSDQAIGHLSADRSPELIAEVESAIEHKAARHIQGSGSKRFFAPREFDQEHSAEAIISSSAHRGIMTYEPTELVMTARSGTPVKELRETLAASGQCMPFEPPEFSDTDTLGGVIACGLSGPARPYTGSARDYVLGMHVINGKAESLRFGGEVMKNVAGYDVSRLQTGAFGTLGLILDVSMKVLPLPESVETRVLNLKPEQHSPLPELARKPLPLSASAIIVTTSGRNVFLRFSGSQAAVNRAGAEIGGEILDGQSDFWNSLAAHTHPFFSGSTTGASDNHEEHLWRISVPDFTPDIPLSGVWLQEWGGALRWLKSTEPADKIFATVAGFAGHATCYSRLHEGQARFQPLSGPMLALQRELKLSFDPQQVFNPGWFHPEING